LTGLGELVILNIPRMSLFLKWSRLRLGKSALRRKLDGDARLAEQLEVRA